MLRTKNLVSLAAAAFVIDTAAMVRIEGHQCNFDAWPDKYRRGAIPITLTANVAANGVALPVVALTGPVGQGAKLYFGEQGEFALVTATAQIGAVTIAVEAIPSALENGDVAYYVNPLNDDGAKVISGGVACGEDNNGLLIPAVAGNAIGLAVSDMAQNDHSQALTGFGVFAGGPVWENLLPDATGNPKVLPDAIKTALRASGTGWAFRQYVDSWPAGATPGTSYN